MALPRRSALVLLVLGLSLLLGFIFRGFLLDVVVKPIGLLLLLLWRTVLSVDQRVYWGILIGFSIIYIFVRLARELTISPAATQPDSNVTLDKINHWRLLVPLSADEAGKPNVLKDSLGKMLTAIFTSRQPEAVHWEVNEALRERRIPVPDSIYAFLFPAEPPEETSSFRRRLRVPGEWLRALTGRDAAEYYRSIEEVLAYMESAMEKKHDQ
jgi:hypothetical protein